jgi:hypothetical protein
LRDELQLNKPFEMPWKLISQFVPLSDDQAKAKGLYCPTGIPPHDRPLDEWTEEELLCALAELSAGVWMGRLTAAAMIVLPPMGLLIFGYLIGWIVRGFRHTVKL